MTTDACILNTQIGENERHREDNKTVWMTCDSKTVPWQQCIVILIISITHILLTSTDCGIFPILLVGKCCFYFSFVWNLFSMMLMLSLYWLIFLIMMLGKTNMNRNGVFLPFFHYLLSRFISSIGTIDENLEDIPKAIMCDYW